MRGANLTKTGRVSKATKGQPVHHCECGKTYTRAEHLRRHKQNHKPGAYPCDITGCERAFYREDLLVRHKSRHHGHQPSDSLPLPSTGGMPGPPSTEPLLSTLGESDVNHITAGLPASLPFAPGVADHQSTPQPVERQGRKGYIPITEMRGTANFDLVVDNMQSNLDFSQTNSLWISPPAQYSFESSYNTPEPVYQYSDQLHVPASLDIGQGWTYGTPNTGHSRSPTSAGSRAQISRWERASSAYTQLHTPASEKSYCESHDNGALPSNPFFIEHLAVDTTISPEYRDLMEENDLVTPTSAPQATGFGPNQFRQQPDNEQRYLDAYWTSVHPSWPVIHKPTFDLSYRSPLLRASMYALGASAIGHQVDYANACIIHKRCLKVLKKRTDKKWHSYRVCDMQATFLVELFSASKSRRPPFQLSRCFTDSYAALLVDDSDSASVPLAMGYNFDTFGQDTTTGSDVETKHRLLAACYLLDQFHATLFDRPTNTPVGFEPATLTLPQLLPVWDMEMAQLKPPFESISDPEPMEPVTLQQAVESTCDQIACGRESSDLFTSSLILAHTYSKDARDVSNPQNIDAESALQAPSSHPPQTDLTRKTLTLCHKTPIRSLLAVAGESWIMGEKLNSRIEYKAAQQEIRKWASTEASKKALAQALEILHLHRNNLKSPLLFHEWSLHLASLVVWARSYAARESTSRLRLEIPSANVMETIVPGQELDGIVSRVVQRGAEGKCSWDDVKGVLMWAKARMEKTGNVRFCGVVSGAVDVMGRLVGRGDEDGWF